MVDRAIKSQNFNLIVLDAYFNTFLSRIFF